jgi:hypothetical protein
MWRSSDCGLTSRQTNARGCRFQVREIA